MVWRKLRDVTKRRIAPYKNNLAKFPPDSNVLSAIPAGKSEKSIAIVEGI